MENMEDMMKQRMGMMKNMMGQSGGKKHGMGRMGKMMDQGGQSSQNGMGGMGDRMRMCRNMTQSVAKSADMASFATEEIRGLFQDWLGQAEAEVLTFIEGNDGQIDIAAIANQLSISEKSARYLVSVLFQRGAIDLGKVHITQTHEQQAQEQDETSVDSGADDAQDE